MLNIDSVCDDDENNVQGNCFHCHGNSGNRSCNATPTPTHGTCRIAAALRLCRAGTRRPVAPTGIDLWRCCMLCRVCRTSPAGCPQAGCAAQILETKVSKLEQLLQLKSGAGPLRAVPVVATAVPICTS